MPPILRAHRFEGQPDYRPVRRGESGTTGSSVSTPRRCDTMPDVDTAGFDAFVDGLDYPMFVVTTAHDGRRAGCLVGFTTQASVDPPRMLVCLSVRNHTYRLADHAALLAVHVLDPDQRDLAELFGGETGDAVDKFSRCSWAEGPGGVPLLDDCPRVFVGRVLDRHRFGDHVGFLLEPTDVEGRASGQGLTYEQVEDVDAGHPA
jgi:flavin reductase (DIM6/NTAB) family NADH-FMN oxidoreductase RutF